MVNVCGYDQADDLKNELDLSNDSSNDCLLANVMSPNEFKLNVSNMVLFFGVPKDYTFLFVSFSLPTDSVIFKDGPNIFWIPSLEVQVILFNHLSCT